MTALDFPSQASLAALPPRDKRRVATLIQQLLRVSKEHQRAAERWEAEHTLVATAAGECAMTSYGRPSPWTPHSYSGFSGWNCVA